METMHELVCEECGKEFLRSSRQLSSSKSKGVKNYFCTRSCGVRYNNKHYGHGERRSFVEKWLEGRIAESWPTLEVHYNRKDTIGSELDIFIPLYNFAIELNGPTHYQIVYNQEVLENTQKNDEQKRKMCQEKKIDLLEVNMSRLKAVRKDPEFVRIVDLVLSSIRNKIDGKNS